MIFTIFILKKFLSLGYLRSYIDKVKNLLPKAIFVLLLLFSVWFILKLDYKGFEDSMVFPARFKDVPYNRVDLNNFIVNIPEDGTYCWNLPLPSSIIQKHIGITDIEMRGPDLKYGFRVIMK
jgi:hypothetical protein